MNAKEMIQNEITSRKIELGRLEAALRELNDEKPLKPNAKVTFINKRIKHKIPTSQRIIELAKAGNTISAIRDKLKPLGCFRNYKAESILPSIGSTISRWKKNQKRSA